MSKILLSAATLLLIGTAAVAAPATHKAAPAKHTAKAAPLVCPVTGDTIASVKDAAGHSTYKGKTYYFCCSSCKPEFDKNPAKYTKQAAAVGSHTAVSHKM